MSAAVNLGETIDPVLAEHYPDLKMTARHANVDGMAVFEVTKSGLPLCWVDADVLAMIGNGDDAALEIMFDEVDRALLVIERRSN